MAPELRRYLHHVPLDERLRDELLFSNAEKIRMYPDFERPGVRLRGTYNQFSKKMEFPLDTDLTVTLPTWKPDAVRSWVGFSEISYKPDGTSIGWKLNDGTDDYYWRDYPSDLLVLTHYNDLTGQTFTLDYFRDGTAPTITTSGSPAIVAPGVANFGAGALELDGSPAEGLKYVGPQLASMVNTGTIRFRVKTNYSGTPTDDQLFFGSLNNATAFNFVALGHDSNTGNVFALVSDDTGSGIAFSSSVLWNPTAGVWSEWEMVFDTTPGSGFGLVLRIDGTSFTTAAGTGSRSGVTTDAFGHGAFTGTDIQDFVLDELKVFNTVQHTSDYTPETEEMYTPDWEIAGADDWNTEIQITDHISTFQHIQKEITPIANLVTTDKDVTPVLKSYSIAMDAQFDWWEDIVIRSLIPRLREDFQFIHDHAGYFEAGGTTFNVKTDEDFKPDQDLDIIDVDSVYDYDSDPTLNTDLLSSYNVNTGEVTLSSSVTAGNRLYIKLKVQPQVVINYPNTDYIELAKTPSIIIEDISIRGDQVHAQSEMVDKKTSGSVGYKTEAPFWAEQVIVGGVFWAGGNVDAQRLLTRQQSFLVKGSSRSGHKPGGMLQSKALGVYYTMRQRSPFRHGPRAAITDLKTSAFQIILSNVYVWLNDVADKPVVDTFNYAMSRRRDSGPAEEYGITPPLNAGTIKTLYQKPEIEES